MTRRVWWLILAVAILARPAPAGAAGDRGSFFVYAAPASAAPDARAAIAGAPVPADTTWVHVGGGGEAALGAWGIGSEFGGLAGTGGAGRIANVSIAGFFHPLSRSGRLDPYVALGNSWFIRDRAPRTLDAPNAGGGVNYWLRGRGPSRLGLKVEFRGYGRTGPRVGYRELRVGVCLSQ